MNTNLIAWGCFEVNECDDDHDNHDASAVCVRGCIERCMNTNMCYKPASVGMLRSKWMRR